MGKSRARQDGSKAFQAWWNSFLKTAGSLRGFKAGAMKAWEHQEAIIEKMKCCNNCGVDHAWGVCHETKCVMNKNSLVPVEERVSKWELEK